MGFKDHFSGHAAAYSSHRPGYPAELFEYLSEVASGHSLAWDCATGNGQAAVGLAPYFDRIIATDASGEQIANTKDLPENIELRTAPAEDSGLASGEVDLLTVAQALHWFDFDRFFDEVKRVLTNDGVIAVWGYGLTRVNEDLDALIDRFYTGEIDSHWPPERAHVDSEYRDIPFPFDELSSPEFSMRARWQARDMLNYLRTWSSVKRCEAATGRDPVLAIEEELLAIWGDGELEVRWPIILRVGR